MNDPEPERVPDEYVKPIRDLVHELVVGNYEGLEADGRAGRLTAARLEKAVADLVESEGALVDLPDEAFTDEIALDLGGVESAWAIDMDLWTVEGPSDYTLQLDARPEHGKATVKVRNLHML